MCNEKPSSQLPLSLTVERFSLVQVSKFFDKLPLFTAQSFWDLNLHFHQLITPHVAFVKKRHTLLRHHQQDAVGHALADQVKEGPGEVGAAPFARAGVHIEGEEGVPDILGQVGPKIGLECYLRDLPVEKVWGIGPNTASFLRKFGVVTALDFARKDEKFIEKHLSKPFREIWNELNGRSVYPVATEAKSSYQSISKARTFTPPSNDEAFVFAQLAKNLENACIKARRYRLAAARLHA